MSSSLLTQSQHMQTGASIDISRNLTPIYTWIERFRFEYERLRTFEYWPLEWLDGNMLAMIGMFYTGVQDHTKCYFCKIVISKWEQGDDPIGEHLRWSPNCPLLLRRTTDNVALNPIELDLLLPLARNATYVNPSTRTWMPNQNYSIRGVRLNSFASWPRNLKQKPEELAEAGFYYKGNGDCVVCFSCMHGLKNWEENDDPWEQHALWLGQFCSYVKQVKGEEYIAFICNKFKNCRSKGLKEKNKPEHPITPRRSVTSLESDECKMCKICFERVCNTAYVPCGHVLACTECAMRSKECPVCRAPIKTVVRLYFS